MIGMTNAGAGGSLDFRVVGGTTQPASPRENTLWVNTANDITGYAIGAEVPASPSEGFVWIMTRDGTKSRFSVSSRKEVMVYPAGAYQFISNVWTVKALWLYQNAAWEQVVFYLYKEGEVFTPLTGGWKDTSQSGGRVTFQENRVYMTYSGSTNRVAVIYPNNAIDYTGFTTLHFDFEVTALGSGTSVIGFYYGVGTDNTDTSANGGFLSGHNGSRTSRMNRGEKTIDVSGIDRSYFVKVSASLGTGYVYNIWLT